MLKGTWSEKGWEPLIYGFYYMFSWKPDAWKFVVIENLYILATLKYGNAVLGKTWYLSVLTHSQFYFK